MSRCRDCRHIGLCAPDCVIAPWNLDVNYPAPNAFSYLLRQRRWAGSPVERRDTLFDNPKIRYEQEHRFCEAL